MALACFRSKCCDDVDNCCGKELPPMPCPRTGVGGGKDPFGPDEPFDDDDDDEAEKGGMADEDDKFDGGNKC